MSESGRVERRRQFCGRCGQLMFEFYRSPDGHFGLASKPHFPAGIAESEDQPESANEVHCPTCRARYRLLDRLNAMGQPIERL